MANALRSARNSSFLALTLALTLPAVAEETAPPRGDVVHTLRVADLVKEERPDAGSDGSSPFSRFVDVERLLDALAEVRVDGGEGVFAFDHVAGGDDPAHWRVLVKTHDGAPAHGELWLPGRDPKSRVRRLDRVPFTFPADAPVASADAFEWARKRRAAFLASLCVPGTPLFQHLAEGAPPDDPTAPPAMRSWWWSGPLGATNEFDRSEFGDTFELFSGGRALQENLQIDRMRDVDPKGEAIVAISSIEGITTSAVDWKARLGDAKPAVEPLAAWVPADQIYVGFDSFGAMVALLDEMERRGDTFVHLIEPRSEDAGTRGRLERQLCLSTSAFARLLGPKLVRSVAFTASDPYLREGTDVAVLFDCVSTEALALQLASNWKEARAAVPGCADVAGERDGVKYLGVASPDRRVSSYFAAEGGVAIVANSKAGLERLLDLHAGKLAGVVALGASDEMAFFRSRYPAAGGGEARGAGLLVLSDPFLRRFCGPAWRIGESRRLRCAGVASRLDGMRAAGATEDADALAKKAGLRCPVDASARFEFVDGGARCSVHGGAGFLTPVAELPVEKANAAERDAYVRFRSNYENYWRQFFDPIALQFETGATLAADLTVLPLIKGTEYEQMRDFAGGTGGLTPKHGDPHDSTLLHLLLHVNPDSETLKEFGGYFEQLPGVKSNGLSWLGDSFEIFLDDGPFWDQLAHDATDVDAAGEFLRKNGRTIPFGISLSIRNPLAFTGIVVALRAFVEQSMPNQLTWETREHAGLSYVVVKPRPSAESPFGAEFENTQLCYGSAGSRFWLALDEGVIQRALERAAARNNAALPEAERDPKIAPPPPAVEWPGRHACASVAVARLPLAMRLFVPRDADRDEVACFANLPLLEELRRRDPATDPVQSAARLFGVRPVCPDGGNYVVDADLHALACTKHGHPTAPRRVEEVPSALAGLARIAGGITFEKDGLRLRFEAQRTK